MFSVSSPLLSARLKYGSVTAAAITADPRSALRKVLASTALIPWNSLVRKEKTMNHVLGKNKSRVGVRA